MSQGDTQITPKISKRDEKANPTMDEDPSQQLLEELKNCQNEITVLDEKSYKEKNVVSKQFECLKKPHFSKRNDIIERIPHFWCTVFECHPQLYTLVNEEVADCLRYMTKIDVEYIDNMELSYKIHFFFRENPYIENDVLTKEVILDDPCNSKTNSTPIRWKYRNLLSTSTTSSSNANIVRGRKRKFEEETFFNWFCNNDDPLVENFADIIKDEAWQNPIPFYLVAVNDEMVCKDDLVENEVLENIEKAEEGLSDDDELVEYDEEY